MYALSQSVANFVAKHQRPDANFFFAKAPQRDRSIGEKAIIAERNFQTAANQSVKLRPIQFPAQLMNHTQTITELGPEKREWFRRQQALKLIKDLFDTLHVPNEPTPAFQASFLVAKDVLPCGVKGQLDIPYPKADQPTYGSITLNSDDMNSFHTLKNTLVHELLHAVPEPKACKDQLLIGFYFHQPTETLFDDFEEGTVESLTLVARLLQENAPRAEFKEKSQWIRAGQQLLEHTERLRCMETTYPEQVNALLGVFDSIDPKDRPFLWGALLDARSSDCSDLDLHDLAIYRVSKFLDTYNSLLPPTSRPVKYSDLALTFGSQQRDTSDS